MRWRRGLPGDRRVCGGTAAQWRKMWNALLAFFSLSTQQGVGFTMASLRGGGATFHYLSGTSLDDIAWQGRWASKRTLEIYIQEVTALTTLGHLPAEVQQRILRFSRVLPHILKRLACSA